MTEIISDSELEQLVRHVQELIDKAASDIADYTEPSLVLYWKIGRTIYENILKEKRENSGKCDEQIISAMAEKVHIEYGRSFSNEELHHMLSFVQYFPNIEFIYKLGDRLSWMHILILIHIENQDKRNFYVLMSLSQIWSIDTLINHIDSELFERTILFKKPDDLITYDLKLLQDEIIGTNSHFKNLYYFDNISKKGYHFKKDVEIAILRRIEQFLMELNTGFCFAAHQKCIKIDNIDYYLDLLFYNRR
jgi:predicted nuclease of restriction endonuclease-like (RecB) superfamily